MTQLPPIENSRALAKRDSAATALVKRVGHPVVLRLARLRDRIPPDLRRKIGTAGKRSVKATGMFTVWLTAVAIILLGGVYLRLFQGPISMDFLLPTIEKAVSGQIPNSTLNIRGAVIRLGENKRSIEFRLTDVSLLDDQGEPVAQAPLASIGISTNAMMSGRIAASEINFIGAKLIATYSENRGLALAFSEERAGAPVQRAAKSEDRPPPAAGGYDFAKNGTVGQAAAVTPETVDELSGALKGQINLVQALSDMFERLRQEGSATSYLTKFGIRQAEVYFDHGDRLSRITIPNGAIRLSHQRKRSVIDGQIEVVGEGKPWRVDFRAVQRVKTSAINITASLSDVVPRSFSAEFESAAALAALDMPVTLSAHAEMASNGDIVSANLSAELGRGFLHAPWDKKHPAQIDGGLIRAKYLKSENKIVLLPSHLRWDESRIAFTGLAERVGDGPRDARWVFSLKAPEPVFNVSDFNLPPVSADSLDIRGAWNASRGVISLDRFHLQAADAFVSLKGEIGTRPGSGRIRLNGDISPMPLAFWKLIWPKFVAYGARDWVGKNITTGRITGGKLAVDLAPEVLRDLGKGGDVPPEAVSLTIGLAGLTMNHIKGLPPIQVREATASITGRRFVFDAPGDSRIALASGVEVTLNSGQFIVGDLRQKIPYGEVHFKGTGDLAAVAELLDHQPLAYVSKAGFRRDMFEGIAKANFSIGMPMLKDLTFKQLSLRGKTRVENVRATGLEGGVGVHGGTMLFDVTEKAIEAQGELRVNGVEVQLAWQKIFDAPAEHQPPIRIRGIFDEKARENLGLSVNHMLKGDIPAEVQIGLRTGAPPAISLEADLTNADLFLTNIGWRKPPGQRALLSMTIERDDSGRIKLDNFRILGDDMTITGWVAMNEKRQLAAFHFPNFSFNILTKLEIAGRLSPQNVWKVEARGRSYDGRQFFRSLFSAGKLSENQPKPRKDEPGIDIHAEIDTVIGYYDTTVQNVTIDASKRNGKLASLDVYGRLNGEAPVAVKLETIPGKPRVLLGEASDAGAAFRLVGFYPSVRGGEASLKVDLDGEGAAEKQGTLYASNFVVTGDQVVGRVVRQNGPRRPGTQPAPRGQRGATQQAEFDSNQLQFDRMTIPFAVGHGQFVLLNSAINGPLLGATMRGRIDFERDVINLSGTYVPAYGINAMIGVVPLLGDLLTGRRGEGIFGITFAIQGPVSNPNVLVNPMSLITPGFLRGIMEFDHTPPRVIPRTERTPAAAATVPRASSQPPVTR